MKNLNNNKNLINFKVSKKFRKPGKSKKFATIEKTNESDVFEKSEDSRGIHKCRILETF